MTHYTDYVSDEPIESIRFNVAEHGFLNSPSTRRIRRLFNEIERLEKAIAERIKICDQHHKYVEERAKEHLMDAADTLKRISEYSDHTGADRALQQVKYMAGATYRLITFGMTPKVELRNERTHKGKP